jgi:Tfp pilus assembly protein PilF
MPAGLGLILLFSAGLDLFGFLALYDMRPFGPWERLLTEFRVIIMYLSLLLYPVSHRFSIDHPITISESLLTPPATLLSALLLLAILAGAVSLARRHPLISFAVIFFFLNHLVESTILPIELVFEHRNYLPSMFLFLPVAVGILRSLAYFSRRPPMQGFIAAFITLVIIGLGHATYMRNFAWKNEKSLWISCLENHPNSFRAHHNLGRVYQRRGQREMARRAYQRALKCENLHSKGEKGITYFNLGFLAYEANEMDKAMAFYLKALQTDRCCPGAHNNLAGLLSETGAPAERILEELMMAVECNQPIEVPLALSNLGVLLVKEGRADEAVSALQRSLRLDPQNELTLLRLGHVYRLDGRLGMASDYFMRVLKRNPRNMEALLGLADIHVRRGASSKAYGVITRIVDTLRPEDFSAFIAGMRKKDHLLRISPDVERLFGLLHKAYDRRALQFKENAERARDLDQQVRTTP